MYNSRPRRIGYERYPESFAVPENYSGSAFRGEISADDGADVESEGGTDYFINNDTQASEATFEELGQQEDESVDTMAKKEGPLHTSKKPFSSKLGFGFNAGKLLGGSFGIEELLLIGLILLISQSENNEDIIALLVLLLFIG